MRSSVRRNQAEPYMVQDPITKQFVNLLPFFTFIHTDNVGIEENIKSKWDDIDEVIRLLSIGFEINPDEIDNLQVRNIYITLFELRDLFSGISVIKS